MEECPCLKKGASKEEMADKENGVGGSWRSLPGPELLQMHRTVLCDCNFADFWWMAMDHLDPGTMDDETEMVEVGYRVGCGQNTFFVTEFVSWS